QRHAYNRNCRFRKGNSVKHSLRSKRCTRSEQVGHGNLKQPISEEINDSRCECVAGAVERLHHDHAVGVGEIAVTDNSKAIDSEIDHSRIARETTNDGFRKKDEHKPSVGKNPHVEKPGEPYGPRGAIRFRGTEVLPDECRSCPAKAPGRQYCKKKNSYCNCIPRHGHAAECTDEP